MGVEFMSPVVERRARLLAAAEARDAGLVDVEWEDLAQVTRSMYRRLARVTVLAGLRDPEPAEDAGEVSLPSGGLQGRSTRGDHGDAA